MGNDRADRPKIVGPLIAIFGSTAFLLLAAWVLWITHNEKAQGAAITLVGVAASHLVKEVQQLLRSWLRDDGPIH
jgi:hypothetical protein